MFRLALRICTVQCLCVVIHMDFRFAAAHGTGLRDILHAAPCQIAGDLGNDHIGLIHLDLIPHSQLQFLHDTDVMDAEEAKKCGAMALFGEKYGDTVRVVGIKDENGNFISRELCGGTHVDTTAQIRLAKVVQESAISAGSRRIEIVVSDAAYKFLNERAKEAEKLAHLFKSQVSEIGERVDKLIETNKTLTKRTVELQKEIANAKFSTFLSKTQEINGGKLFISKIEDFEPPMVKEFVERLSDKLGDSVIVVASIKKDGGVFIMVKASDSFVQKGVNAGKIVGEIASATKGKGGFTRRGRFYAMDAKTVNHLVGFSLVNE